MADTSYRRIDLGTLNPTEGPAPDVSAGRISPRLRWLLIIMPLALAFCFMQAVIVILAENLKSSYISSTLISVIGFVILTVFILIVNPALRLLNLVGRRLLSRRVMNPFTRSELITLFAAVMVSSGVSSFGLTSMLVPLIPTPFNPEWNTELRGWSQDVNPHLNQNLYITDEEQIRTFREGVGVPQPLASATIAEKAAYCIDVFAAIPWHVWMRPLGAWLIFIFGWYALFYCLAFLVLNYWSQREKLIFPLATLPQLMLHDSDQDRHWLPPLFRHPLFWGGMLLAIATLSYNAAWGADWIGGLGRFKWGMGRSSFYEMVDATPLAGFRYIGAPAMQFHFGFVAIAIAFLIPTEISFSMWFYFLLGQAILFGCTTLGYRDFATDFLWNNHQVSAMAGGGMLLFSAISLYRSFVMYAQLARGQPLRKRIKLALPVVGLILCVIILTRWMMWNGLPLHWALLFLGVTTLVTIGVMRLVAESGVYWVQVNTGFFHLFKVFGLGKWISPTLIGPLLPIFSVLFLDIKTFLAPNLLHAAKMRQDTGASRTRFHVTVVVTLVVSVTVCLATAIYLAYMIGAQQMNSWFYVSCPPMVMDTARAAMRTVPEVDGTGIIFYGVGAIWIAITTMLRQFLFWFPHPIGFIMHVNPDGFGPLWLSFFIGWACKKSVVKYGGKSTFDTAKLFFIGLLLGEILCCFVWPFLALLFGFSIVPSIDMNRYEA